VPILTAPVPTISWRRVGFIPGKSTDGRALKVRLQGRESKTIVSECMLMRRTEVDFRGVGRPLQQMFVVC